MKAEATPRAYRRATARLAVRRPSWIPAAAMLLGIVAVGAVVAALSRPPSELDVAAITDDPLTPTNEATGFVVVPVESDAPTTEPAATDLDAMPDPLVTDRPGGGPTPAPPPGPGATPKPTSAPTPAPTPTPPPAPTPTPPPPTPGPTCLVPNFINTQTTKALQKWTGSGFTGPMTIEPAPPPNYQIGWQSLAAGTMEPCTSGITVRDAAP